MSKCAQAPARRREPLQEQRRGHRAGLGPGVGVVLDVGDVAVQRRVVAAPTAACATAGRRRVAGGGASVGRQGLVVGVEGRQLRARAPRAPRRSGWPGRWSGPASSSPARVRASARISRPSASVLPISTVRPGAAGEHVARPHGVAGDGVLHRRDQHRQPHRQAGAHDHAGQRQGMGGAAHVLLHQPHAGRGLMSRPPVSNTTPLPTMATSGSPGSPQAISIMRGARRRARRGRRRGPADSRPRAAPRPAIVEPRRPNRVARGPAASSISAGPMSLAGVLTMSRARAQASATAGDPGKAIAKRRSPAAALRGRIAGPVAVKAIAAERPGEGHGRRAARGGGPARR